MTEQKHILKDELGLKKEEISEISFNILFAEQVEVPNENFEFKHSLSSYHKTKRLPVTNFYKKISSHIYE